MSLILISGTAVALFALGSPILLVIAIWVAATSYFVVDFPLTNMGFGLIDSVKSYVFLAVPLFVATGDFLTEGGISRRLVHFARSVVGVLPGATTCASIVASGLFAAISGSNSATAATMGRILGPAMRERGMDGGTAAAVIASAGTVGVIIPPSVIFIVYGITLNVSSVDLFVGGVVPGMFMVLSMLVVGSYLGRRHEPSGGLRALDPKVILRAGASAWLGFIAIGIIFFGVYNGLFSPTEAAGVVTIFSAFAGVFITRQIGLRKIPDILLNSAALTGLIVPLVAFSLQFQQVLSVMGANASVQSFLLGVSDSWGQPIAVALMMALIFFVGAVTESVAVVLILAPILAPVAAAFGFDPIHWGVVFVVGTSIGFVSPPYGLNLFVTSAVLNVPYADICRKIWAMLIPLLVVWWTIAAMPWTALLFQPER